MEIPGSMKAELAAWNNGEGIDIESWIGCSGSFSLAVGYACVFWPNFVLFDDYILWEGFSESSLRGFESQQISRKSVEWTMNHLHIADIQSGGCADISRDKLLHLGIVLKEIYEAKLLKLFPNNPCNVEFYKPPDEDDLIEYQLSFWQKCHE